MVARFHSVAFLFALILPPSPSGGGSAASPMLAKAFANLYGRGELQIVELATYSGERKVRSIGAQIIRATQEGKRKLLLRATSPPDIDRLSYLALMEGGESSAIFSYLPALGIVRRISGSVMADPVMGTALAYDDLAAKRAEDFHATDLEGGGGCDGNLFILVPRDQSAVYDEYDACVSPVGTFDWIEMNQAGRVVKRIEFDRASVKHTESRTIPLSMVVHDFSRRLSTRVSMIIVLDGLEIPRSLLSLQNLSGGSATKDLQRLRGALTEQERRLVEEVCC